MKHRQDKARIVRALLEHGPLSNLEIGRMLKLPNPANRISDARDAGAPIEDDWQKPKQGGPKFKRYKIVPGARAKARRWLSAIAA